MVGANEALIEGFDFLRPDVGGKDEPVDQVELEALPVRPGQHPVQ